MMRFQETQEKLAVANAGLRNRREQKTPPCALGLHDFEPDDMFIDRYAKTISRWPSRNKMCRVLHITVPGLQTYFFERRDRQYLIDG